MFKTRGGYYMRYAYITKIFSFESAHHLPGHRGKCARLHGHSYRLEITLRGPIKDSPGASDHGMVTDFADLSLIVKSIVIERLDHQYLNPISAQEVAERVQALGARHVVLTGGEPTLQKDLAHLAQLLKDREHHLTIETNTTIFPPAVVPLIDLWSLSPKLSSAGENYLRYPIIERFLEELRPNQQQWKFVIGDDADEQALRSLLIRYPAFAERLLPVILQPEGDTATLDYPSALEDLAKRVHDPFWDKYYVRVLPHMHVIIWGRRRWVYRDIVGKLVNTF